MQVSCIKIIIKASNFEDVLCLWTKRCPGRNSLMPPTSHITREWRLYVYRQESGATSKMTARCALYVMPWKFSSPWVRPHPQDLSEQKPVKNFNRGRSQELPKIFRAPIYYIRRIARSHLCDSSTFLLDQELIPHRYSSCSCSCCCCCCFGSDLVKKPKAPSFQIGSGWTFTSRKSAATQSVRPTHVQHRPSSAR